jgi:corrinoid protein of di/trimethylamine methyltransferase
MKTRLENIASKNFQENKKLKEGKMDLSNLSSNHKEFLDLLKQTITEINEDKAVEMAHRIIDEQIDPWLAIKYSIAEAAKIVGEKFECGDYFLPHLVMAGDLIEKLIAILEKGIPSDKLEKKRVIVIGTVRGDMHSVGKNIVATMLRAGGFEVHDMGVDIPSSSFIQRAIEVKADMIALSSLLTTTMPYQKEVIDELKSMGLRTQLKVMIGGGPVTRQYAESIGADGYGKDGIEALEEAKRLLA